MNIKVDGKTVTVTQEPRTIQAVFLVDDLLNFRTLLADKKGSSVVFIPAKYIRVLLKVNKNLLIIHE